MLLLTAVTLHGQANAARLTLTWTDNSNNEDGFKIELLTGSTYGKIVTVGANVISYTDSGLLEGTIYCYRVGAFNSAKNSPFSNEACVTTPRPDVDTDGDGLSDKDELNLYGTDPMLPDTGGDGISDVVGISQGSGSLDSNSFRLETGEVLVDHTWKRVEFSEPFLDPIVVAKPLSFNGPDPAVLRIRNVGSTAFDIRIQEWNYLDGGHTIETVGYIVMERGSYVLGDGTLVVADSFETNRTGSFGLVPFYQSFNTVPVVLTAVSSFNGSDTVTGRVRNISTQDFEFGMQEQESKYQAHLTETISYIAWEPSAGTINGFTFEVNATQDVMTSQWQRIPFDVSFVNSPVFLADMQTTDGRDTAALRWRNKDPFGVEVKVEEEQSRDNETYHTTEMVGYMIFAPFSGGVEISQDSGSLDSNSFRLETGEVTVDHNWKRVEFSEPFLDPIVVAKPLSFNGSQPAVLRIRNVGSTAFDIRIQEWNYLDGGHTVETVGYIVMERGSYILADGTLVEADSFETDRTNSFGLVPFNQSFNTVPVVLTAVSSFNGSDTVTSRVRNISTQDFEFGMQEQESKYQAHLTETISYIAWEPSAGTINGFTFEVNATQDVITDQWQRIPFDVSFVDSPVFLADMQTTDGRDTAALRWRNKDPFGVEVKVEEERSRDSETGHTTEMVGYMVFTQSADPAK